jgi:hypothetical protein
VPWVNYHILALFFGILRVVVYLNVGSKKTGLKTGALPVTWQNWPGCPPDRGLFYPSSGRILRRIAVFGAKKPVACALLSQINVTTNILA